MSMLDQKSFDFDENDVQLMKHMLRKFNELHEGAGVPDYSTHYTAYLPVFAIALLISQQETARLSKRLERLTWALVFLTVALIGIEMVKTILA